MFVYVGQTYRAAKTGTAVREVKCEKCGCDYRYRLFRRGHGVATSPYYINMKGAQKRAESGAAKRLQKLLLYGVDPVPCPDCNWFQADMVDEYQSRFHGWLHGLAITFGILLGVAAFLWLCIATKGFDRAMNSDDKVVLMVLCGLLVAGVMGPILLRRLLIRFKNPNKNFPQRPDPIPGAPKAFRPGEEGVLDALPANADGSGTIAYENAPPEIEPGGWLTQQIALWPVPRVCCSCMTNADTVKQYTATGQLKLPVRLCPQCRSSYRKKYALWFIPPIVIGVAAGFLIGMPMATRREPETPYILAVVIGIVGLIVGAILAAKLARPIRFSRFNGPLNTIRVRFANPNYMPMFMEAAPPTAPTVRSPMVNDDYNPSARPWQA